MRTFDHLHTAYIDASADPRLHGIARGLGLLLEAGEDDDLPEEVHDLGPADPARRLGRPGPGGLTG